MVYKLPIFDYFMDNKKYLEQIWFILLNLVGVFEEISKTSFVKEYNNFLYRENYKEVFLR